MRLPALRFIVLALILVAGAPQNPAIASSMPGSMAQGAPSPVTAAPAAPAPVPEVPPTSSAPGKDFWDLVDRLKTASELLVNLVSAVAFGIGGAWIWLNHLQGRVGHPKLELSATGQRIKHGPDGLARVVVQAKNVGTRRCDLVHEGTLLDLYRLVQAPHITWKHTRSSDVLSPDNDWIEPGATITDELVLPIDTTSTQLFRVEVVLSNGKITWKTSGVF